MVIARGHLWWTDLGLPVGSQPGFRRPVLIVSSDDFNDSAISTVVVAAVTSNVALGRAPGYVVLDAEASGLAIESVVNVSQISTIDKRQLDEHIGALDGAGLAQVDAGLRLALDLDAA